MFGLMKFIFPDNQHAWWSPAFLEMGEHLPADEKQWMTSLFGLLESAAFALPIKMSLCEPTLSPFWFFPLSSCGGSELAVMWYLDAHWG